MMALGILLYGEWPRAVWYLPAEVTGTVNVALKSLRTCVEAVIAHATATVYISRELRMSLLMPRDHGFIRSDLVQHYGAQRFTALVGTVPLHDRL